MDPTAHPLHLRRPGDETPRIIAAADVNPDTMLVFDVRREADFNASDEAIPGALWKNPDRIDAWIGAVPLTMELIVYCVHGGAVSLQTVDRLRAIGAKARYIEGGLEAWKAAGGRPARKYPIRSS